MVTGPLLLVYALYLVFLVGFLLFSAFGLFHLEEYGYDGDLCRPMIYLYVALAATIMLVTFVSLVTIV